MRKPQFIATTVTLGLAIPFAFLAILGTGWVTDHLPAVVRAVRLVQWPSLAAESSARWPEVAGMIVGQLLIVALLLMVRRQQSAANSS
jgi:hypothetical protein